MPKNNKGLKLGSEPRFISPACGLRTQHRIISTVSVQTAAIIIALIYTSGGLIIIPLSKKKILRILSFNILFSIIFTAILSIYLSTRKYKLYLLKVCPTWLFSTSVGADPNFSRCALLTVRAVNKISQKFAPLGPSPCWKHLLALSHLKTCRGHNLSFLWNFRDT